MVFQLYRPKLKDGKPVQIPWQMNSFKLNCIWPLEDGAHRYNLYIVQIILWIVLITYISTVLAEMLFLVKNIRDIELFTQGACTTIVGLQFFIRIFYFSMHRTKFRKLLEKYYDFIYITKEENKMVHKRCESNLNQVYFISTSFLAPLFTIVFLPLIRAILNFSSSSVKPYFYPMLFPYNAQEPLKYIFTTIYTGWVGISCVAMMIGEDVLICGLLSYTEGRYFMLHNKLNNIFSSIMQKPTNTTNSINNKNAIDIYMKHLLEIIKQQQLLDNFVMDCEEMFSFLIFIVISFETLLLCFVAFQLSKAKLLYIFWLFSACLEMLVLGNTGQKLTDAALNMGNAYYMSNWELLLPHGTNLQNAKMMKVLAFAIFRSNKPIVLTGMNFFQLSLSGMSAAISSSVSYFMFLNTMQQRL